MAQSIMTATNRVYLLGGKYDPAYASEIFELERMQQDEAKDSARGSQYRKTAEKPLPRMRPRVKALMKQPRVLFGLVSARDRIFILGGNTTGERLLRECEEYTTLDEKVHELPPLCEPKEGVASCTYQDRWIYVFGGRQQNFSSGTELLDNFSRLIEQFDMEKNIWMQVAIQEDALYRGSVCSAACQAEVNKLVLFGGVMWHKHQEAREEPKPLEDKKREEDPPYVLSNVSLMFETVDYTVKTRTFSPLEERPQTIMCSDYFGPSYCVKGGIYAFNNGSELGDEPAVYCYDQELKEWKVHYFGSK